MVLHTPTGVIYAPLYIHSFQLVQPHTLVEAEKFNIQYTRSLSNPQYAGQAPLVQIQPGFATKGCGEVRWDRPHHILQL